LLENKRTTPVGEATARRDRLLVVVVRLAALGRSQLRAKKVVVLLLNACKISICRTSMRNSAAQNDADQAVLLFLPPSSGRLSIVDRPAHSFVEVN
jgi:hypothetical protein